MIDIGDLDTLDEYTRHRLGELPIPIVHHDRDQLTIAVTFDWGRPWALDHCEAGYIVGEVRRVLEAHFGQAEWTQLRGVADVVCFEPNEERWLGRAHRQACTTKFAREAP